MVCGMALGFKAVTYIETTNGNMGMVKVWFSYAVMEPGNIFSAML